MGRGTVAVYDGIHQGPVRHDGLPRNDYLELTAGDRYDLRARRQLSGEPARGAPR